MTSTPAKRTLSPVRRFSVLAGGTRLLFLGVVMGLAGTVAASAARPDLRAMSCRQAQEMIRAEGAVVATTGRYTYRRFVSHQRYCDRWEGIVPALSPTRDNPRCLVGYICEEPLFRGFGD